MEYVSVYTTSDKSEISLLKSLFEREKLNYKIASANTASGEIANTPETVFEVAEEDRDEARKILHESGLLQIKAHHHEAQSSTPMKRWVFLALAAIILILVMLVIWWFMNSPE